MAAKGASELTVLARLVAKEAATSGRPGESAYLAARVLERRPEAALDLLDLIVAESRKKRPNGNLIMAYTYMFGQTLEYTRYGIEAGHGEAGALAERIRARLLVLAGGGDVEPELLLLAVSEFGNARLEPGDELRAVMTELVDRHAEDHFAETSMESMQDFVANLASVARGDAFGLHRHLTETGAAFPDDHRLAMAVLLLRSGEPVGGEAAIGWLLDPSSIVRARIAGELVEAASQGVVTSTMLRRMIAVRNWLPDTEGARSALDSAIQTSRRKGVECGSWPGAQVRDVLASGVDGSGAIGVLAVARDGRKQALGTVLMKHRFGVRDAWVQRGLSRAEIDGVLGQASSGVDQFAVDHEFLKVTAGHFLAVGLENGNMPPFDLLDAMEMIGLSSVQPQALSTGTLLALLAGDADSKTLEGAGLERLLARSGSLGDDYMFLDSWFEDGDEEQAVLGGKRMAKARRLALALEKLVEPRRAWWADLLAWTAFLLRHSGGDSRWMEFWASAHALMEGRPLSGIPLMLTVARQTIDAVQRRS
jgi:hypothetical protein